MTCNLAVSITKAAVTPKQLRDLVSPEIAETVIKSFMADQHPDFTFQTQRQGANLLVHLLPSKTDAARFTITITPDWSITTRAVAYGYATRGDEAQANQFTDEMTQLLSRTADALFARQVQAALTSLGGQLAVETVTVEEAGQSAQASLITITL